MSQNTNKLTVLRSSVFHLRFMVMALVFVSSVGFSQEEIYTILHKNINPLAFELSHELSVSQDSLVLQNKQLFYRVRFLNTTTERIFTFSPGVKAAKLSLKELPLGNYTVMFYQDDKIIVFQIDRLLPLKANPAVRPKIELLDLEDAMASEDVASSSRLVSVMIPDRGRLKLRNTRNESKYYILRDGGYFSYNLSISDRLVVQSRAEYRRTHLRPNGKPYTD